MIAGVVLAITTAAGNGSMDEPVASPSTPPTATADAADESVCGIGSIELSGTLSSAPEAEWAFQGTTAYPTSSTAGPGVTSSTGIRSCFEHSPTGALFMAANAIAQGSDGGTGTEWAEQALGQGQYRDELLTQLGTPSGDAGTRIDIAGFRVLAYDGATARIDLAVKGSANGTAVTLSAVYELVWQDGDWKLSADTQTPLDMATVPDVAGYINWGA
ncbi:hypothetical protein LQ757_18760 [Agromyces sp. SYSU K20354]|uniref:hypothetical protein n=1 Tax=Agromyces cavernae TaxID=2898659 RepID=UPI001E6101A0|nr:hypothetical protein [Agromyces cavernae]MCD2444327.1 hypothetical protein [Agromyces cavernae]